MTFPFVPFAPIFLIEQKSHSRAGRQATQHMLLSGKDPVSLSAIHFTYIFWGPHIFLDENNRQFRIFEFHVQEVIQKAPSYSPQRFMGFSSHNSVVLFFCSGNGASVSSVQIVKLGLAVLDRLLIKKKVIVYSTMHCYLCTYIGRLVDEFLKYFVDRYFLFVF